MTRLIEEFNQKIRPKLFKDLGLNNLMAVPEVAKIVISMGLKEGAKDRGVIDKWRIQLAAITGQLPRICRARKSIANFSLVKGSPIGLSTTLRGKRMYDFLEKLIGVVFPRTRDFRGVPLSGFDGRGNYNLGLSEINVFPEIDYNQISGQKGLEISIVTNAKKDDFAKKLLEELGLPFAKS